jgi:hypothetical protein
MGEANWVDGLGVPVGRPKADSPSAFEGPNNVDRTAPDPNAPSSLDDQQIGIPTPAVGHEDDPCAEAHAK